MIEADLTPELREQLENDGYLGLSDRTGRDLCGILRFAYTVGIVWGIDEYGYRGRWCYSSMYRAIKAFVSWTGEGDPPGEWIKYKGEGGERSRIKDEDDEQDD